MFSPNRNRTFNVNILEIRGVDTFRYTLSKCNDRELAEKIADIYCRRNADRDNYKIFISYEYLPDMCKSLKRPKKMLNENKENFYIFLDIDGVLAPHPYFTYRRILCDECVQYFNDMITTLTLKAKRKIEVTVVIHSSWRHLFESAGIEHTKLVLRQFGLSKRNSQRINIRMADPVQKLDQYGEVDSITELLLYNFEKIKKEEIESGNEDSLKKLNFLILDDEIQIPIFLEKIKGIIEVDDDKLIQNCIIKTKSEMGLTIEDLEGWVKIIK